MVRFNTTFISRYAAAAVSVSVLLLFMGSLHGCGGPKVIPREQVTFHIAPHASVNAKNFLTENYDNIADMVYADPPDESLLAWHILMPGQNEKVLVAKPDKLSIGVYVLFTQPGEKWKMLLEKPFKSEYKFNINKNVLEEYRKGMLW
jgi:hypothetical protein